MGLRLAIISFFGSRKTSNNIFARPFELGSAGIGKIHMRQTRAARAFTRIAPLLGIVLFLVLSGCEMSPEESFIQGYWSFANETGDERSGTAHLLQEWWFGGGRFYFQQEIAAGFPILAEGRYRILERDNSSITLEMFQVNTNSELFTDGGQIRLEIDRANDTLRVNRVLYVRSGP